jgi:hypothetical protein
VSITVNANLHSYNGTAAVGDFITITVDRDASTITFHNWSTGNSGTLSYTVDADGAFLVDDPVAEIVKAYEIPGFALVAWDQKAKDGTQKALVFAFEKVDAQVSDFANFAFASLEFRTSNGGTELLCATVDSAGVGTGANYIPLDQLWPPPFNSESIPFGTYLTADSATGTLLFSDPNKPDDAPPRFFKTDSGAWGLDAPGGSGLWFPTSAASTFPETAAGTYFVLGYRKTGEGTSDSGIYGTPAFFNELLTVTSSGALSDGTNTVQLEPLREAYSDTPIDIDACNGLFAFTPTEGGEGFAFVYGNAIYFSTFHITDPVSHVYNYSYGVALRR